MIQLQGLKKIRCLYFMESTLYQSCSVTSLITLAPRVDVATPSRSVEENIEVFLDELPRLQPSREIDFIIELHPNVKQILFPPYWMASVELREFMS